VNEVDSLGRFIRENRGAIIERWMSKAALLPSAQHLRRAELQDHVPRLLDALASAVEQQDESAKPLADVPEAHAALRFRDGYDLPQVVAEYRLLRLAISDLYTERGDVSDETRRRLQPLTVMHEAVDRAISDAVDEHASERDRVRETFIAMLGHDLREPLQSMLFTADRLGQSAADLSIVNGASRIVANARLMDRMIHDLLDFARGRLGGGLRINPTRFDAGQLVCQATQELAGRYPERQVRCVTGDGPSDFVVEWDSDRISQVVTNLVGNALAHGRDPILVTLTDERDHINLRVTNAGEIPGDVLPRLFQPFPHATQRTRHGLGLGLYIVGQVAFAHGGTVDATSAGGTTTVSVRLPRYSLQPDLARG